MAFATQEDVFAVAEDVLSSTFQKFSSLPVTPAPFPRITYRDAMLTYGTDKPDLRNPLKIIDLSDMFVDSAFKPFCNKTVRAINAPGCGRRAKSFMKTWANSPRPSA